MGLVLCKKHGSGFVFVCQHISNAVWSDANCNPNPIRHIEFTAPHDVDFANQTLLTLSGWFCPACIEEHHLPLDGMMMDAEPLFLEDTSAIFRPMCPGCFEEWRAQCQTEH